MAGVVPFTDPSDYSRAHARIKKLWDHGTTEILGHAKKRMRERGVDIGDIRHVIKTGIVTDHSCPKELWRYTIQGNTPDGDRLRVVVEVNGRLILVTVVDLK